MNIMSEGIFVRRPSASLSMQRLTVPRSNDECSRSQPYRSASRLVVALREAMLAATIGLVAAWLAAEAAILLLLD